MTTGSSHQCVPSIGSLLRLAADKLGTVGWKEQQRTWGVGRKEQGRVPRENCLVWQLE